MPASLKRLIFCLVLLFFSHSQLCLGGEPARVSGPYFEKYPASEIFTGTPAPVDLGSHASARRFRTRLTLGAQDGPNFARHYTIIEWGCGTSCQQIAVVDAKTGRICDWLITELGSSYELGSKLFVKNPDLEDCSRLDWCDTKYYLFKNGRFELLK